MYIKGVPRKKKISCLSSQKFLYPSLFLSVSLRLLCTESAFPIKDWSIFVHKRHELQKSSDKIIFFLKYKQYTILKENYTNEFSSTQQSVQSRMAWFQHCHYYSLKQPPSILRRVRKNPVRIFRDFILQVPRIEMEIPGGWGSYLFPSCLMLTSCPSLGKLLSFSSIQKAPINVDNSAWKSFWVPMLLEKI